MSVDSNEVLRKSVTEGDLGKVLNGSVLQLVVPYSTGYDRFPLPPAPPPYWSIQRDQVMRATIHHEAMWAAAVAIAVTKAGAMAWRISGHDDEKVRRWQEILLGADGGRAGWVSFMAKTVRDYLTTDNGCFIEIVRARKWPGSEIVGLRHLDSVRCTRTGDPDYPVIYRDRLNRLHQLHDYQVLMFSDMPDPSELYWGIGMCAASRAYRAIYKLATIEWYLTEKVGGLHPMAIYVVNGVLSKQLEDAVDVAQQSRIARGLLSYMGAVVIGVPDETQPQVATIPLAELPDRFNRKEEFDISLLTYADNLGLDIQDLQPLSGQALGTGSQSLVLHDKARGKGLVAFIADFTHQINRYVLPEYLKFGFTERDWRDEQQQAALGLTLAQVAQTRIAANITSPEQELQLMVKADQLPKEILKKDLVDDYDLSDEEKPEEVEIDSKLSELAPKPAPDPLEMVAAQADAAAKVAAAKPSPAQPGAAPTARTLRKSDGMEKPRVAGANNAPQPAKKARPQRANKELRTAASPAERERAAALLEQVLGEASETVMRVTLREELDD